MWLALGLSVFSHALFLHHFCSSISQWCFLWDYLSILLGLCFNFSFGSSTVFLHMYFFHSGLAVVMYTHLTFSLFAVNHILFLYWPLLYSHHTHCIYSRKCVTSTFFIVVPYVTSILSLSRTVHPHTLNISSQAMLSLLPWNVMHAWDNFRGEKSPFYYPSTYHFYSSPSLLKFWVSFYCFLEQVIHSWSKNAPSFP